MAGRLRGVDVILGGHTHDAMPEPMEIRNQGGGIGGVTLVVNSGSNGKFLSVLDFEVKQGQVRDYRFRMLPVFSELLPADPQMQAHIDAVRQPYLNKLNEELAVSDVLLYRRGNFSGTFDQLICDALMEVQDAEVAFSPGFRWGVSVLPGEPITFEQVMTQTAITYPTATLNHMSGERIKQVLEDVADNLFNDDPYYQQGGDMVRVGGIQYSIDPHQSIGKRITSMELNGKPIQANKEYKVAGWASVAQPIEGQPVWDVVADYLRNKRTVKINQLNEPKIVNVSGNQGVAT